MTSPSKFQAEPLDDEIDERVSGVRGALLRYRITAYIVGTLLVLLVCVAMPLKYLGPHDGQWVTYTGIPHGWLYMVLLITTIDLGRRVHWGLGRMAIIAVSGLVPFLTFWAEHRARLEVEGLLSEVRAGTRTLD